MSSDHLVQMGNSIAEFFAAMPDHAQAVEGVADHLRKFWEPRMRRQILAMLDSGADAMHPMLLEALRLHRDSLTPHEAAGSGAHA